MRILHTCLRYPPATGGVETYVHELVERTRNIEAGRDVRVLTSSLRTHGPVTALAPESLLDDPPYVQRLHHAATWGLSYPRLQSLAYYLGHHRPDIVHGYSFWYQPADTAARYARRHHVPFILHPMYYENDIRQKLTWRAYQHTIGRRTFAAADVVAVLSQYEQRLIEQARFPVKRFVTLAPGIDAAPYQTKRPNPFTARGVTGTILLAVSRLAPSKGIEDILTAIPAVAPRIPDLRLVVIGEDFGQLVTLKQKAAGLNIADRVHWLHGMSRDELIAAYQHADLFVHASHYEAFGIVLIEALAAGLPVVARRVAAVPEIVRDGVVGTLFTTPDELTEQLVTLLANQALRQQYGEAGKKLVAERYTWNQSISALLNLYNELT